MEKSREKNKELDYKDTAGYRLMQHEEFLRKMIRDKEKKRKFTPEKTV